jgi:hypothetical protein
MTLIRPNPFIFAVALMLASTAAHALDNVAPPAGSGAAAVPRLAPPAGSKADAVVPNVTAPAVPNASATAAPNANATAAPNTNASVKPNAIPTAGSPAAGSKPVIEMLGEADQKIFVVDHDGTWSMHAENVSTFHLVRLWQQAGGPEVTTKVLIDRPFTLSVHKLAPELILERLYEGFGFTMHYDDTGRLVSARVYSPREASSFKTPRLTETLSEWKAIETDSEATAARPQ